MSAELFGQYQHLAEITAGRYSVTEEEREELTAELRLVLWRALLTYEPERAALSTWLIGKLRYGAMEWRRTATERKRRRWAAGYRDPVQLHARVYLDAEGSPLTVADTIPDEGPGVEASVIGASEWGWLGPALRVLPLRLLQVVLLYYWHDLTHQQVGRRMGMSSTRVRQLLDQAYVSLREALADEGRTARAMGAGRDGGADRRGLGAQPPSGL